MIVLSLFTGLGLLDMGFREAGFTVLRGPDLLWAWDIRGFNANPLQGKVDGVIAGVPCQYASAAVRKKNRCKYPNLWPEFFRVVDEVEPRWALAECVPGAKRDVPSWTWDAEIVDFSLLGSAQKRKRLIAWSGPSIFWKNLRDNGEKWGREWREKVGRKVALGRYRTIHGDAFISRSGKKERGRRLDYEEVLDAFDLSPDWRLPEFAEINRRSTCKMLSQGVPVAAAYALAMAVKEAQDGTK